MPRKNTGSCNTLVIGDTHCPAMHPGYIDFLVDTYKAWGCNRVVHIGDVVDWSAISFHEKCPTMPSAGDEILQARQQVRLLTKAFKVVDVLIGNHDSLPERQARVAGLPSELLLSYKKLWDTPNWRWHPRYSSIVVDNVRYTHGEVGYGGQRAAIRNATENARSTVQGHLHSQCSVNWVCSHDTRLFGMQTGCGIDIDKLAFEYNRRFTHRPILGCGIVLEGKHAFNELMEL